VNAACLPACLPAARQFRDVTHTTIIKEKKKAFRSRVARD
jgi:hypothetical protein